MMNKINFLGKKFKRGMTLAEVAVAVALTALCIAGILGIVVQCLDFQGSIDYSHDAINIAKSRLERLRQIRDDQGFATAALAAETDTLVDSNGVPDLNGDFKRTTTIDSATFTDRILATVSVSYKRKGVFNPQPVVLATIISQYS